MAKAVMAGPRFQRVVAPLEASGLRMNPLEHMIDRICVDRCYSYAYCEPATAQFRVRVEGANPIVVSTEESLADRGRCLRRPGTDLPVLSSAGVRPVSNWSVCRAGGSTCTSRWTGF
jgi:hypothetical protein